MGDVETDGGLRTRLFRCPDCETTFIAARKQTCHSCGTAVEEVPSEMDLDYGVAGA